MIYKCKYWNISSNVVIFAFNSHILKLLGRENKSAIFTQTFATSITLFSFMKFQDSLWSPPFSLKTFVSISFRLGLLVTILGFPSSEYVFILTSFLRYVFTGYRILSWQFFSFRILKMLFCLLWFLIKNLQSLELLFSIFNVLYFSSCFQDFFLYLLFSEFWLWCIWK